MLRVESQRDLFKKSIDKEVLSRGVRSGIDNFLDNLDSAVTIEHFQSVMFNYINRELDEKLTDQDRPGIYGVIVEARNKVSSADKIDRQELIDNIIQAIIENGNFKGLDV